MQYEEHQEYSFITVYDVRNSLEIIEGEKRGEKREGDILLFCFGSWASAGSQREFQAHAERGSHPRETDPAARCRGSKRGSKSFRWKLVRFFA